MISARSGRTEVTDILLTGENIDPDIQENVRISSCAIHVSTLCTPSVISVSTAPITPLSHRALGSCTCDFVCRLLCCSSTSA